MFSGVLCLACNRQTDKEANASDTAHIGRVWHSFTNSFLSCCELFLSNTFSCKTVHGEAPFLCSHKRMKRCRAGKEVAFHSSPIAQIVGEVILRKSFFKIAQLHRESCPRSAK